MRRFEVSAVVLDSGARVGWIDEVRERVWQSKLRRRSRAPHTRAEQPDVGRPGHRGRKLDAAEGVIGAEAAVKERDQLEQLFGEVVLGLLRVAIAPQCE